MRLGSTSRLLAIRQAVVSATPAEQLDKREVGGILICQGPHATGPCSYGKYELDMCHDMPPGFIKNAATFAPDGEAFYCFPRVGRCADICTSPTDCTFGAVSFDSPLKYDLGIYNWQTLFESFDCHLNQTADTLGSAAAATGTVVF
ncbi:uncharacterized protein B0I36DRAFT_237714 [Microdochium trichocladiopsis]|uniref:Uncharacterized protein n=1 Tax=Microdochium trichocladiopsis TaxID=1682393 RepID=A0A9P8YF58_9PEZI|nr:uncharacterized protein B0I36DRAFT_237714 [Microdochium trichocladiopsis]KAH7038193.1 hypothetical protein B0I36DRAFT_237714 [Microdochium trichocladiopsis]